MRMLIGNELEKPIKKQHASRFTFENKNKLKILLFVYNHLV